MRLTHISIATSFLAILLLISGTLLLSDVLTPQFNRIHQILFFVLYFLIFINVIYISLLMNQENRRMKQLQQKMEAQMKEVAYYSDAKDSFIANISHELKTPLNAILGVSYFLRETKLSKRQQELVAKIENSSDVLLSIINDVLDLSKLKSEGLALRPAAFHLVEVVENVENMFSEQLRARGISWHCCYDFHPDLSVRLDKFRISQILINLVGNASKFTEEGFISLEIETTHLSDSKIDILVRVQDSGIGIAKRDVPMVFKEFEQVENHMIKDHQGTGLGLTITKNLIEAMGGKIWLDTAIGEGSNFSFLLPSVPVVTSYVGGQRKDKLIRREEWKELAPILVVEDTEINGEVTQQLLLEMGLKSDLAIDGLIAIDRCRTLPPDYYSLILMDIHMPQMDGYTAATILKQDVGVNCPIVALTATAINDTIKEKYKEILDGFILKPLRAMAFQKELTRYLGFAVDGGLPPDASETSEPESSMINMGGREDLYVKYMGRFHENYRDLPAQVKEQLELDDYKEAHRLVHSMKGLAGMLGMFTLYEVATTLEDKLEQRNLLDLPSCLDVFEKTLNEHLQL